jgi:hypothetical protein
MRIALLTAAIVAFAAASLNADQLAQPRPIGPNSWLNADELCENPVLIAPGQYAVIPVCNHIRDKPEKVGVIAIDVLKGGATAFENPFLRKTVAEKGHWMCDVFSLAKNTCGIVFYMSEEDSGETRVELFTWDLEKNKVSSAGRWPLGLIGLFGAIDMQRFSMSCSYDQNARWTGKFDLHSKGDTANTVSLTIDPSPHEAIAEGALLHPAIFFISGFDRNTFTICKSPCDGAPIELKSITPSATPAERWRWSGIELGKELGTEITTIGPLRECSLACETLLIAYEGKGDARGFISIDKKNGKIVSRYKLDQLLPANYGLVSPHGETIMFRKEEPESYCFLQVGRWTTYDRRLRGVESNSRPFGFIDQCSLVSSTDACVLAWNLKNGEWASREVYRLPVPAPRLAPR